MKRTLKQQLQYIKDAGFEIDDPETEDMLRGWYLQEIAEVISEATCE